MRAWGEPASVRGVESERSSQVVLLVEDDEDIRSVVGDLLRDEGYVVAVAEHGRAAVTLLEDGLRPSVILLDLMMPLMNGWEFYEHHQSTPALTRVPLIVMTASDHRKLGDARVLRKPVDLAELLAAVRSACTATQ